MKFSSFSELSDFIRRYSSTSVLEVGTQECWKRWAVKANDSYEWTRKNTYRNYAVRIMLLASYGNPHRKTKIKYQDFNSVVEACYNWEHHTISNKQFLDQEAKNILYFIQKWESKEDKAVRNWTFRLSDIFSLKVISDNVHFLFFQRLNSLQNASWGSPKARILRTIKFIQILEKNSGCTLSNILVQRIGLKLETYFKQFIACLGLFRTITPEKGFYNFNRLFPIDKDVAEQGITGESLRAFVKYNSAPFHMKDNNSFRCRLEKSLSNISENYQPFFYNLLLDTPLIYLEEERYCLPDPTSFTESCWNQVKNLANGEKKFNMSLGDSFEYYLEHILFPLIAPTSVTKIPPIDNSKDKEDKRADFLIDIFSAYIVIECKSSLMSTDTSVYFEPKGLANFWCRIHGALEQIARTAKALNSDKPVIPLVITFYDSNFALSMFEEIINYTDYCSFLGLKMKPILRSLHELEHQTAIRSLPNWVEDILEQQSNSSHVQADNLGHRYQHLENLKNWYLEFN